MAKANLLIHIGTPKTGTTLLQKYFSQHRESLKKGGLLYPETALRGFGHHDIAFMLDGGFPEWAKPVDCNLSKIKQSLKKELNSYAGDILISSENFYLFPRPKELHQFLTDIGATKNFYIKLISYVRRQDEAAISWYNQRVKAQGYTGCFEDSIEDDFELWCYHSQHNKWANIFGKESVSIHIYDEAWKTNSGLLESFCTNIPDFAIEILGQAGSFDTQSKNTNTSLSRDLLEFQRIINRLPLSIVDKRQFHQELMQLSANDPEGHFDTTPVANQRVREEILSRYRHENTLLEKKFLCLQGDTTNGIVKPYEKIEESNCEYTGLTKDKIAEIIARLLNKKAVTVHTPPQNSLLP